MKAPPLNAKSSLVAEHVFKNRLKWIHIVLPCNIWCTVESSGLALLQNSWWRHQMETFSALLALCAGNSPVPVISPHKGQWRGILMFSLICAWINDWVNNREAGDLRRHHGYHDVIVMLAVSCKPWSHIFVFPFNVSNVCSSQLMICGMFSR